MKPIGVWYATREGQTKRIAHYVATALSEHGASVHISNVRDSGSEIRLDQYSGVILAASIHIGKHEPEMVKFVKDHLRQLQNMPAAFLSVSLSQAGVELPGATAEQRAISAAGVQAVLDKFYSDTGWRPKHVKPVAGALLYTKYNFLIRFIMKRIARKAGGSTDTSRDHEYTDWTALRRFAGAFAEDLLPAAPACCKSDPATIAVDAPARSVL